MVCLPEFDKDTPTKKWGYTMEQTSALLDATIRAHGECPL